PGHIPSYPPLPVMPHLPAETIPSTSGFLEYNSYTNLTDGNYRLGGKPGTNNRIRSPLVLPFQNLQNHYLSC
uniref:Uncharacterized protein n=1 Tax=Sciurus vulgaris TaxID=55149 RepID=A0A8D2ASW7_SCIVU